MYNNHYYTLSTRVCRPFLWWIFINVWFLFYQHWMRSTKAVWFGPKWLDFIFANYAMEVKHKNGKCGKWNKKEYVEQTAGIYKTKTTHVNESHANNGSWSISIITYVAIKKKMVHLYLEQWTLNNIKTKYWNPFR